MKRLCLLNRLSKGAERSLRKGFRSCKLKHLTADYIYFHRRLDLTVSFKLSEIYYLISFIAHRLIPTSSDKCDCQIPLFLERGNAEDKNVKKYEIYLNRRRFSAIWDILIILCTHIQDLAKEIAKCHFVLTKTTPMNS